MMGLAYDVGLDNASAWFAGRAYNQLDNVYYIAFATEVSIGTGDMEKIDEYGSKFILDESFGEYCSRMDEQTSGIGNSYAQYVYGQVCMAKYRLGKGEEAVELSFSINEDCFPPKNAAGREKPETEERCEESQERESGVVQRWEGEVWEEIAGGIKQKSCEIGCSWRTRGCCFR